jgi:hypothetical protein
MVELEKVVAAMIEARSLLAKGDVIEGYEIAIDGVRLYAGRYFREIDCIGAHVDRGKYRIATPILPHIISFSVSQISADKRPALSIICALSLADLLNQDFTSSGKPVQRSLCQRDIPDCSLAEGVRRIEQKLSTEGIIVDVYSFSELDYAVLSLPAEPERAETGFL